MMKPTKEELLKRAKASIDENEPDDTRDQLDNEQIDDHNAFIEKEKRQADEPMTGVDHLNLISRQILALTESLRPMKINITETISENAFRLNDSIWEVQKNNTIAPDTKQQIHIMVSDFYWAYGWKLKDIQAKGYKDLPSPGETLEDYVTTGQIFSQKTLRRAENEIRAVRAEDAKARQRKSNDSKEGARLTAERRQKEVKARQQILKSAVSEDFLNEWRRSGDRSFPKYFHKGLHGNIQPPPIQLKDYVHQDILKVSLDTLRADLKALRINPKRKP